MISGTEIGRVGPPHLRTYRNSANLLRLQGTSRQPARSVYRGDLRPWVSSARTLSDHSHGAF